MQASGQNSEPTVIATVADPTDPVADLKALVYAYDKGARMTGGLAAPARRVHLFGIDALNQDGAGLVEAAVAWALGNTASPLPQLTVQYDGSDVPLTWPVDGSEGSFLQQSKDLDIWSASPLPVTNNGHRKQARVTPGPEPMFFRLARP